MRRTLTPARILTGAAIIAGAAAVLAYAAYKTQHDGKISVDSIKSTIKDAAKDIDLPIPVSAADVNKFLEDKGQKISDAARKEQDAIASILEDTAKKINKAQRNFRN